MNQDPENENPAIEPEVIHEETALTRPSMPVTIDELAVIPDDKGIQVIQARYKMIDTLRRASISLTSPQDWLLFKSPEGAVTAYLQDSGCKRIWQIWGIEISPREGWDKITDDETGDFACKCYGTGVSKVTGLFVENIERVRYSHENYCKDLPKLQQEVRVKQAAIANRDGNIIRALTGLKSVALEMLEEVWKGTGKNSDKCARGKGFGSKHERAGVGTQASSAPDIDSPICSGCNIRMQFIPAGERDGQRWEAYYKCKEFKWDSVKRINNGHDRITLADWEKKLAELKSGAAQ
jgi:hypothetical protein